MGRHGIIWACWFTTALMTMWVSTGCKSKVKANPQAGITAQLAQPSPPVSFELQAEASATINRDPSGDPLSVFLHFFQLKDKGEFSKLTYDLVSSGRTDQELLGADLLGKTELLMVPGAKLTRMENAVAGTKYIGIVAYFRKPDSHYWRYLVPVEQFLAPPPPEKPAKTPPPDPSKRDNPRSKYDDKPKPPATKPGDAAKPAPNSGSPRLTLKVEECYLRLIGTRSEAIPGQPENAKPECAP